MTPSLWIILFWVAGLVAAAIAGICGLLAGMLRIVTGSGSSTQKRLFGAALIFLAFGILAFSTYATAYVRARGELEGEIARVRERGEPLWFAEFEPEPVDPELDATALFRQAMEKLQPPSEEFDELMRQKPHPEFRDHPELREALEANREALELLSEALKRTRFRWPYDYSTQATIAIELPHVDSAGRFARLLRAKAIQSLAAAEYDLALSAIEQCFALSELLREEPFAVCLSVRIRYGSEALNLAESLLAATALLPVQIAALDAKLAEIEPTVRAAPSVVSERAALLTFMQSFGSAESAEALDMLATLGPGGATFDMIPGATWKNRLWGSLLYRPFLLRDEGFMIKKMCELIDVVDQPRSVALQFLDKFNDSFEEEFKDFPISGSLFPAIDDVVADTLRYRQRLNAARLALRVDRYRVDHGELPATLDPVVDDALHSATMDLFSGRPLIYKLTGGGFAIYPEGKGEEDEEEAAIRRAQVKFEVRYEEAP